MTKGLMVFKATEAYGRKSGETVRRCKIDNCGDYAPIELETRD